jgi:large subunit ribosomal protein L23
MNVETATKIILRPYVTEKTFALVENEQKVCFLVEKEATKPQIVEAVKTLYNEDAINIQTARTIYGKKAFVKFNSTDKARDLANKIGMM